MSQAINDQELEAVNGGAGLRSGSGLKLVCSNCHYTVSANLSPIKIQFGEMAQCPKCRQVTLMLQKAGK